MEVCVRVRCGLETCSQRLNGVVCVAICHSKEMDPVNAVAKVCCHLEYVHPRARPQHSHA